MLLFPELHICPISAEDGLIFGSSYQSTVKQLVKAGQTGRNLTDQNPSGRSIQMLDLSPASLCVLKGRVERIFFFASFKLPLFNEYEMVFIIA